MQASKGNRPSLLSFDCLFPSKVEAEHAVLVNTCRKFLEWTLKKPERKSPSSRSAKDVNAFDMMRKWGIKAEDLESWNNMIFFTLNLTFNAIEDGVDFQASSDGDSYLTFMIRKKKLMFSLDQVKGCYNAVVDSF